MRFAESNEGFNVTAVFAGLSSETPTRQWRTQEFCLGGGGFNKFSLRTEDREKEDLGAVATYSGVLEAAVIWYKKFHFI